MEIKRDAYLQQLIERKDNGMIKVITGIRRCGKSFLLFTIFKRYLLENGVDTDHIIEIALDGIENEELRDPKVCYKFIKDAMKDSKKYYLLLDEVQFMPRFRILSIQAILLVSASVQNHDRQSFVPFFRPSKLTVSTIVTLLPATIDFSPVALSAAVVWIVISGSYSSVSVPKSITVLFLETTTSKAGISVIPLLESQRNSSIV